MCMLPLNCPITYWDWAVDSSGNPLDLIDDNNTNGDAIGLVSFRMNHVDKAIQMESVF